MSAAFEEVGDLFVGEDRILLKLLPSHKEGSLRIDWFAGGSVTDAQAAAGDISELVKRTGGRSSVVRGLTVLTRQGRPHDTLARAVERAGYKLLC